MVVFSHSPVFLNVPKQEFGLLFILKQFRLSHCGVRDLQTSGVRDPRKRSANEFTQKLRTDKESYLLRLKKLLSQRYLDYVFNGAKLRWAESNSTRLEEIHSSSKALFAWPVSNRKQILYLPIHRTFRHWQCKIIVWKAAGSHRKNLRNFTLIILK